MKYLFTTSMMFLGAISAGCATQKVALDTVTESAVASNDATAIVQGCGNPPAVGIAYCRITEGRPTDEKLFFYAPPSDCKRDNCAFLKVWDNSGNLVFGAPFPKGQTKLGVSWKVLLGQQAADEVEEVVTEGASDPVAKPRPIAKSTALSFSKSKLDGVFDLSQRGFWSWNLQVYFVGQDGKERQSQAQGDIVLRILKKKYLAIQEVSDDPNFVWEFADGWQNTIYNFRYTSALRAYVGPK